MILIRKNHDESSKQFCVRNRNEGCERAYKSTLILNNEPTILIQENRMSRPSTCPFKIHLVTTYQGPGRHGNFLFPSEDESNEI